MIKMTLSKGVANQELHVASGSTDSKHTLVISNLIGPGDGRGYVAFKGIILDKGKQLMRPQPKPTLKMEVYGDSFTEGVGGDCTEINGNCGNNNGYNSYANVLARLLNAQINNIGIGGLAVRNGSGWYESGETGLETTYNKLDPSGIKSEWMFSTYVPDLVVFGMGVNDEYKNGFSDTIVWLNTYKTVIRNLYSHYGKHTPFILAPGNINCFAAYKYSKQIADELREVGFNTWFMRYSFELDAHPNKKEHAAMAQELLNFISKNEILLRSIRIIPPNYSTHVIDVLLICAKYCKY